MRNKIKYYINKLKFLFFVYVRRDQRLKELRRWLIDQGDTKLRFDYELDHDSVVFDAGGYLGEFADKIRSEFDSQVFVFEPHPSFFSHCSSRFEADHKVTVLPYGLSGNDQSMTLTDSADASSFLLASSEHVEGIDCEIRDVNKILHNLNIKRIDLMKINIEGGEYELLDALIKSGDISKIINIQVQFHDFIENAEVKRNNLIALLKKTHRQTWNYNFVWENWEKI